MLCGANNISQHIHKYFPHSRFYWTREVPRNILAEYCQPPQNIVWIWTLLYEWQKITEEE